jgi:hypothetical protein
MSKRISHRHLIALPLMLLGMTAVAAVNTVLPASADMRVTSQEWSFRSEAAAKDFSVPLVVAGRIDPNSTLSFENGGRILRLDQGVMHVRAFGVVTLRVRDAMVTTVATDITVIAEPEAATFVAINAPVLVTKGERTWIVPPMKQLRLGASEGRLIAVPSDYLARERTIYAALPSLDASISITDAEEIDQLSSTSFSGALTLLASRTSSIISADAASQLLAKALSSDSNFSPDRMAFVFALAKKVDPVTVPSLLALRLMSEGPRVLPASSPIVVQELFASSPFQADLPTVIPFLASEMLKPLISGIPNQWATMLLGKATVDPSAALAAIHKDDVLSLPDRYRTAGYPEQARLWEEAIQRVAVVLSPLLSPDQRQMLERDQVSSLHRELETVQSSVQSSEPSMPSFTDEELITRTHVFLSMHAVLQSTLTTIVIDQEHIDCVRIGGVFLPEGGKDVPYAFTYDIAGNLVRDIVRNGVRLPNSLTPEKFFAEQ